MDLSSYGNTWKFQQGIDRIYFDKLQILSKLHLDQIERGLQEHSNGNFTVEEFLEDIYFVKYDLVELNKSVDNEKLTHYLITLMTDYIENKVVITTWYTNSNGDIFEGYNGNHEIYVMSEMHNVYNSKLQNQEL